MDEQTILVILLRKKCSREVTHRGSYMSAHVLLNLLNEFRKVIKCEAGRAFYRFFATSFINSIIQGHEYSIIFII